MDVGTFDKAVGATVFVAFDLDYMGNALSAAWVCGILNDLVEKGYRVDVLARYPDNDDERELINGTGAKLIPVRAGDEDEISSGAVIPRFRSRQVVSLGSSGYQAVITQGLELSRYVAGNGGLRRILWAMVEDQPLFQRFFSPADLKSLQTIAAGSHRVIVGDELLRSQIDSRVVSLTSRTLSLGAVRLRFSDKLDLDEGVAPQYCVDFATLGSQDFQKLAALGELSRSDRQPPRICIVNVPEGSGEKLASLGLDTIPGAVFKSERLDQAVIGPGSKLLLPAAGPEVSTAYLTQVAHHRGITTERIDEIAGPLPPLKDDAANLPGRPVNNRGECSGLSQLLGAVLPDYERTARSDDPVRLLLVGADFKFAGDLVEAFAQRDDIDFRVDLWKANAKPQPQESRPLLEWAEVIVTEFASYNAIWYSKHVKPGQRLIVHLHGYELISEWIDELRIESVDRIVVASEFYRQRALELKGWPPEKVIAIPNSVNPLDLARPKLQGAQFHLGLVGMVPILKRPDRALDLLELLLEHDDRFVLHIRGHAPWNYNWEWKKAAHQDAYLAFYTRLRQNPKLRAAVSFEPFGADMGNWLRKIGWLLSPSTRETFHMAAIEGACSGAVPIAWRRAGSEEIIGTDFNVDSTEAAAERILAAVASEQFEREAAKAKAWSEKYSTEVVQAQWIDLVHDLRRRPASGGVPAVGVNPHLYADVAESVRRGEFEQALATLDANVPVTTRDAGPLKELELYVRGLAELDAKRYSLFAPSLTCANPVAEGTPLTVKRLGRSLVDLAHAGLDREILDVQSPAWVRHHPASDLDIQPDYATIRIVAPSRIRFDRWVQFVKAEIVSHARAHKPAYLLASGEWWIALPVALAGDELGLPVVWNLEDSTIISAIRDLAHEPYRPCWLTQVLTAIFNRVDIRVTTRQSVVDACGEGIWIDAIIGTALRPRGVQALEFHEAHDWLDERIANWSNRTNPPFGNGRTERPAAAMSVALVGDPYTAESIRRAGLEVVELEPDSALDTLSPKLDAVLIVPNQIRADSLWADGLRASNHGAETKLAKIANRARSFGVPTVWVEQGSGSLAPQHFASARKCDVLVGANAADFERVLQLHPISVSGLGVAPLQTSEAAYWGSVLRSAGIDIAMSSPPIEVHASSPIAEEPAGWGEVWEGFPADEGISAIVTVLDPEELPILDCLEGQSLPAGLLEVIFAQVGSVAAVDSRIEEFANQNPQLTVKRVVGDTVGAARNAALDLLSRDQVLFLNGADQVGANALLGAWLSASTDSVVVLEQEDGGAATWVPTVLHALRGGRRALHLLPAVLTQLTGKLLPSATLASARFDESISAVAPAEALFLATLLRQENLVVTRSAPMPAAAWHSTIVEPVGQSAEIVARELALSHAQTLTGLESIRLESRERTVPALEALQRVHGAEIRRLLRNDNSLLGDICAVLKRGHFDPVRIGIKR